MRLSYGLSVKSGNTFPASMTVLRAMRVKQVALYFLHRRGLSESKLSS